MLKGRNALVTGSTSGIGYAIARALAREGANITLNGFGDPAEIDKLRAAIKAEAKVEVAYSAADLAKPTEIAAMVREAEKRFSTLDVLVNNAGIQHVAPVEEFSVDKWDAIIAINLSAAFHAIRAAVPGMKARNMTEGEVKRDVLLAAQPTKEFVTLEQVSSLAVYLCSDGAASITGANLVMDGGWTAA
jgi:3-hydroxybutyrate dehydrogenase